MSSRENLKKLVFFLETSSEDISKDMIIKSFLKTDISNKMGSAEGNLLWNSKDDEENDVTDTNMNITQEELELLYYESDHTESACYQSLLHLLLLIFIQS